jgi:hypothetical protein
MLGFFIINKKNISILYIFTCNLREFEENSIFLKRNKYYYDCVTSFIRQCIQQKSLSSGAQWDDIAKYCPAAKVIWARTIILPGEQQRFFNLSFRHVFTK